MRSLIAVAACALLGAGVIVYLATGCADAQVTSELREVAGDLDALAAEVQLITDLNTLQLERAQIEALIPAVEAVRATAAGFEQQRVAVLGELRPLLEQKRDLLLADTQPPDDLTDQISAIEGRLMDLDQAMDEGLIAHARAFREILTDAPVSYTHLTLPTKRIV